ncbi:MAG: YabP/YqfC family sporulation protein [Clostridia bacterium]|nr:YabP/YqfC family sporulation protein [Clostridia bacterium]
MKNSFENIEKALSLPYGTLEKGARIVLHSNKEVIVEGCKGISEYDENCIVIKLKNKYIKFNGINLNISSYEKKYVVIKGEFQSIEFE